MTAQPAELPPDLAEALRQIVLQYAPVEIRSVEAVRIHDGKFLSLIPEPGADESWAVGGSIEFLNRTDGTPLYSAEVTEFDPDEGAVWIDKSGWKDFRDPGTCRVRYQPFNFGKVLAEAYERLRLRQPERLRVPLAATLGGQGSLLPAPPFELPERTPVSDDGRRIWSRPWGVIWGPPGTGKTESVARLLAAFIASRAGGRVLAVAPTNIAVDQLALRMKKLLAGLGGWMRDGRCLVYRGGRGCGLNLSNEFPECLEDKDYGEKFRGLRVEIASLKEERDEAWRSRLPQRATELKQKIKGLEGQLPDETAFVIREGRAKVVLMTCQKAFGFVGASDRGALFNKVVIDEAGMVSRAAAVAISTLGDSVLLAGDPKQIGPIFKSTQGLSHPVRAWLTLSPLAHLESARKALEDPSVWLLREQHRMHPDIRSAVSKYTYDDMLTDGPGPRAILGERSRWAGPLPSRAVWTVLDDGVEKAQEAYARKSGHGSGWVRPASAELCVRRAIEAADAGYSVLVLTPYRAQRREIKRLLPKRSAAKAITVGTIHGFQGAERDVVIIDPVNGIKSWPAADVHMIMNVAMSRAKQHFILVAARSELVNPVLSPLKRVLGMEVAKRLGGGSDDSGEIFSLPLTTMEPGHGPGSPSPPARIRKLGDEIRELRERIPLFTEEQVRLYGRRLGEGHRLVRGVAGSGKSLILAHWAVAALQRGSEHRVLVTYFNKGMRSVIEGMIAQAAQRALIPEENLFRRLTIVHEARLEAAAGPFDAVFVDEAQDMKPPKLRRLYDLCKPTEAGLRNLILFADDSQNIYGRKTLEDIKEGLPEDVKFGGRTEVLRESYRSTEAILNLAANLALDPRDLYKKGQSKLIEYMKVKELSDQGLLLRPEQSKSGNYEVCYTERRGTPARLMPLNWAGSSFARVAQEISRLMKDEGVSPGDIMVVCVKEPERAAAELGKCDIPAVAYGGGAVDPLEMPALDLAQVRCTTVHTSKGHESPIVFFVLPEELEDIHKYIEAAKEDTVAAERIRRCMLYVAASRAMLVLYIAGRSACRFMSSAKIYRGSNGGLESSS